MENNMTPLSHTDRVTAFNNPGFDLSLFEMWATLIARGTIVVLPKGVATDPSRLPAFLTDTRASVMIIPTALFNVIASTAPNAFRALRHVITAGEAANPRALRSVLEKEPPGNLCNGYGPTEGTTLTTMYRVTLPDCLEDRISIGQPIGNAIFYLLDDNLEPIEESGMHGDGINQDSWTTSAVAIHSDGRQLRGEVARDGRHAHPDRLSRESFDQNSSYKIGQWPSFEKTLCQYGVYRLPQEEIQVRWKSTELRSLFLCLSYSLYSVYDPNSDHRRKGVYKKDTDALRTKNTTLLTLIQALLNYEEEDAFDLVRQIRSCDNLEDVAQSILGQGRGSTAGPDDTAASGDEALTQTDQFESELAGKMSELVLDGSRKFIGGTSNLIFLPPGSELNEFRSSLGAQELDQGHGDYSVTRWTRVTQDERLISHLMTMYFTWHYPFFTTLSKDLFYRDYIRGVPSQYCSTLLVNAMLALGCHFSSWEGAREDPENSATAGDHFFKEAKRLFFENDEHANAKLCTVQALALLSVREAGCGRESKGWVYSGMSFRMAFDLGLNFDSTRLGARDLGEEEVDARRITFWGCFLFDKCWSNYLGRQPQLAGSSISVPKVDILPNEEAELWSPYMDTGVGREHTQPSRIRAVASQIFRLCEINGDLLVFFYDPTPKEKPTTKQAELKKLSDLHTRLEAWKKDLPKELRPQEGQLPQALLMHMFYQLLLIHLYRPFLKYSKVNSPLPQHVSPRKLCTQAASAISKLLRMYKRTYGFKQICNIAVYIAHTALTVHLLNLPEKNAQRDVIHGLRHLEEMGESWLCARRTLRILEISANKWHVELPAEATATFEQTHAKWGSWGSWDQAISPPPSEESPPAPTMHYPVADPSSALYPQAGRPMGSHEHGGPVMQSPPTSVGSMGFSHTTGPPIPPSVSAVRAAQRSLNVQLAQGATRLPEPTYLRPVTNAYNQFQPVPVAQQEVWYAPDEEQIRAFTTGQNIPATTTSSPVTPFDGPENLVEESQDWWSRESSAMTFGMDHWAPGWNPGMTGREPDMRFGNQYANVGQTSGAENSSRPTPTMRFGVGAPPGSANPEQHPGISGYSGV
ncbi:hypothetical protein AtubIFM57143_000717 [Aspergillus tubingensis]|nr:hypothetical protein AtubIFM57143_000717 [Aspergillus tubingensis]